jgi:excinuclease ABC subunit A
MSSLQKSSVQWLKIHGIRQNNLKNLSLEIPLEKLTVVTGLSGSGKSSLVFDTLHAEGQRRYVETFSPYVRQFLDRLDRPAIDSAENLRPSIALEQKNTVKTTRSTVGTMTELCDYFKIWFAGVAKLHDPITGKVIEDDHPDLIWKKVLRQFSGQTVLTAFSLSVPKSVSWEEIRTGLTQQGFTRALIDDQIVSIESISHHPECEQLTVIVDRIVLQPKSHSRFLESVQQCMHFGQGKVYFLNHEGEEIDRYSRGLHSPHSDQTFRPATPALFSFNSPIGACPHCRGFGRIIDIDLSKAIPDETLSIADGAIQAWKGDVFRECQDDLIKHAKKRKLPVHLPFRELSEQDRNWVMEGDPEYQPSEENWNKHWYGVRGFFNYLESKTYKMHIRVFLSRYRTYKICPSCHGKRLQSEALLWKWNSHTLPDLYELPVSRLLTLMREKAIGSPPDTTEHAHDPLSIALRQIIHRLHFLDEVGLGYLTLDRQSRTLSGGEVERVNLTTCLGSSLVDTLFVLDEPSVGLHPRDISRMLAVLRRLTEAGNTVVVVEHDEAVMRAADHLIELGPVAGSEGGHLMFSGTPDEIYRSPSSLTGLWLSGRKSFPIPSKRRSVTAKTSHIHFHQASHHNIHQLDFAIPLQRLVCLSGVSGSGKSTLLDNVIYQGMCRLRGQFAEDPATIQEIDCGDFNGDVVLVDQGPVSKTPRSNPALYADVWEPIRNLLAQTPSAQQNGFTAAHFSFNSGHGRCSHCSGLGFEKVEMQFLSDLYVTCPVCDGKRFLPDVLAIEWNGKDVSSILRMSIHEATTFFKGNASIVSRLQLLEEVGLGYLQLGQPLNTLSGGESQRLKLVRYLGEFTGKPRPALLLLDEPTTGLHREDVSRLVGVLQRLVDAGHSLVIIEHNLDVLSAADWIMEMGPEAGDAGGRLLFAGPPEKLIRKSTTTALYLREHLQTESGDSHKSKVFVAKQSGITESETLAPRAIRIIGARQHNLKRVSVDIPRNQMTVFTGVSGSGKSSLAFDILFSEGQRRFMESMSAYARQFVEQLPKAEVDEVIGIPPAVAIEQRISRGSRKSTVATVTEVAQYLRLLYARIGIQHSPITDLPLISRSEQELLQDLRKWKKNEGSQYPLLCAPLVRGRKGHYQPLATWAEKQGFHLMRIDGALVPVSRFQKLDRYREHDIEIVVWDYSGQSPSPWRNELDAVKGALEFGKGSFFAASLQGKAGRWFSRERTDPATGESYPEWDPKHFSWSSPKGWCETCHGIGSVEVSQDDEEDGTGWSKPCPACNGRRLNPIISKVKLHLKSNPPLSLPDLLSVTAPEVLTILQQVKTTSKRDQTILSELLPAIRERLLFLKEVGLDYLTLDRSAHTLSGGESQRIRLAAQLGSNLSGVLYVLDEPSIGLHPRDHHKLLHAMERLKERGNTLVVVEHDEETIRKADLVLDFGPGAGVEGGTLVAADAPDKLVHNPNSLTGQYLQHGILHPSQGKYRELPKPFSAKSKSQEEWVVLRKAALRNLKGFDLMLPLRKLTMVCGVSGSGKSTLFRDLLLPAIRQHQQQPQQPRLDITSDWQRLYPEHKGPHAPFRELWNGHRFRQILEVDQSPIGKTPRSTPATYIGAFDLIRQLYAEMPEARMRGHTASFFSFNTAGGRCEHCKGAGQIKLEMSFMPDTYVTCEECEGSRFGSEVRNILFREKSIDQILAMSFSEAAQFFEFHPQLRPMLALVVETGMGYLTLGQSSPTLSGGEAQRLKLVSELVRGISSRPDPRRDAGNFYILEEPTIGLHLRDCERLIHLLHRLVDQGNTVVVIEHHLDLIAEADYLVEIGPEGGAAGGELLYQGDLSGFLKTKHSPTAPLLKKALQKR